jgi:hypothetical protein
MSIALRRHHIHRLRIARRFHFGMDLSAQPPRVLGKAIDTPTPCSCWMCGNPRKYFKDRLTRQEKLADYLWEAE